MITATAIGLKVALGAAVAVTGLSPISMPALTTASPAPNVRPVSATTPGSQITSFYESLVKIESELDGYGSLVSADYDELDFHDLEFDFEANLPPRNADMWRPVDVDVDVDIVRVDRFDDGGQ